MAISSFLSVNKIESQSVVRSRRLVITFSCELPYIKIETYIYEDMGLLIRFQSHGQWLTKSTSNHALRAFLWVHHKRWTILRLLCFLFCFWPVLSAWIFIYYYAELVLNFRRRSEALLWSELLKQSFSKNLCRMESLSKQVRIHGNVCVSYKSSRIVTCLDSYYL